MPHSKITYLLLFLLCSVLGSSLYAEITHTITFQDRAHNYFEVESQFDVSEGQNELELVMANWTPGSYLVRDYSRHIENVELKQKGKLEKIAKNKWKASGINGPTVRLKYRVYAHEMTVRTSWVEENFAFINGAPTFMRPVNGDALPHFVGLELPKTWAQTATSLSPINNRKHIYTAENWDELVDSPIVAGNLQIKELQTSSEQKHYLVNVGSVDSWDIDKASEGVAKVVESQLNFWGTDPFTKPYYFLNLITEGRGGLEHKHSTALISTRFAMQERESWTKWLNLVAHEYFHSWNVKRLRPKALGPFDYEKENYSEELWFSEGLTTYYANLLNYRAGLITKKEFFKKYAGMIQGLSKVPGQEIRSVADASFDAWIRHYRPDENSANATVSYYSKGAMLGFLIDSRFRKDTNNKKSLDDLMRIANVMYSGDEGFVNADIYRLAEEIAGEGNAEFLQSLIERPERLDVDQAVSYYGLDLVTKPEKKEDDVSFPVAFLGLDFDKSKDDLIVSKVLRGTPAHAAGVNAQDELIAIDSIRVKKSDFEKRMKAYRPDTQVELLISRRGELITLNATTLEKPIKDWKLKELKEPSDEQKANLEKWLN